MFPLHLCALELHTTVLQIQVKASRPIVFFMVVQLLLILACDPPLAPPTCQLSFPLTVQSCRYKVPRNLILWWLHFPNDHDLNIKIWQQRNVFRLLNPIFLKTYFLKKTKVFIFLQNGKNTWLSKQSEACGIKFRLKVCPTNHYLSVRRHNPQVIGWILLISRKV